MFRRAGKITKMKECDLFSHWQSFDFRCVFPFYDWAGLCAGGLGKCGWFCRIVFCQPLLLLLSWQFLCHLNCCCSLVVARCFTRVAMSFVFSPLLSFPLQLSAHCRWGSVERGAAGWAGEAARKMIRTYNCFCCGTPHVAVPVFRALDPPTAILPSALKSFVRIYANERQFLPFVCNAKEEKDNGRSSRENSDGKRGSPRAGWGGRGSEHKRWMMVYPYLGAEVSLYLASSATNNCWIYFTCLVSFSPFHTEQEKIKFSFLNVNEY